jgi:hypothetical protein
MADSSRRSIAFDHDGHHVTGVEQVSTPSGEGEAEVRWTIQMDGAPALEFRGPYPYRDEDVRVRVLEWYAIQLPPRG